MAKQKNKPTRKKKKDDDGSLLIERAEKRLAKALASADEAREKVSRRERDLAELMARYRSMPEPADEPVEAIPLAPPVADTTDNGRTDAGIESAVAPPADDRDEPDEPDEHDEPDEPDEPSMTDAAVAEESGR